MSADWTAKGGRTNSSDAYLDAVTDTERIIRGAAASLINGDANSVARCIVSHLAHVHGLAPKRKALNK